MVGRAGSHITLSPPTDGDDAPRLVMLPRRRRRRFLRRLLFAGLAGLIIAVAAVEVTTEPPGLQPLGIPGKWHLLLDSEFDGTSLPADWQTGWLATGVTAPANVLEDDCYSPNNISFPGDGTIHLNVTAASSHCRVGRRPFTGAMVNTDPSDRRGSGFQYTYGVMQARVYLPADGSRLADWPAVWANGQASSTYGEDDLVEGLAGVACWHFHNSDGELGGCDTAIKPGWHTVASDWQKGSVTFYYDGRKVGSVTSGITSVPMFLIVDNSTSDQSPVADSMRVQYVRVWQAST
jgi:hypothetical protein